VEEELELEALVALVADIDNRLQFVLRERHAVLQSEVQRPCFPCLLRQLRVGESKVQLHRRRIEGIF
jgi:hypothetical protein